MVLTTNDSPVAVNWTAGTLRALYPSFRTAILDSIGQMLLRKDWPRPGAQVGVVTIGPRPTVHVAGFCGAETHVFLSGVCMQYVRQVRSFRTIERDVPIGSREWSLRYANVLSFDLRVLRKWAPFHPHCVIPWFTGESACFVAAPRLVLPSLNLCAYAQASYFFTIRRGATWRALGSTSWPRRDGQSKSHAPTVLARRGRTACR